MRKNPVWPVVLTLLIAACLYATGCNLTPKGKVVAARESYTATLNTLTAARQAGEINDATYREIEGYRKEAAAALDAMELASASGNVFDLKVASNAFGAAIDKALAAQNRGKR